MGSEDGSRGSRGPCISRRIGSVGVIALLSLLITGTGYAREPETEADLSIDPDRVIFFDNVIITAPPETLPFRIETDPKAPRQPVPASDGADYLKTIPGFAVIRNGGTNGDPVFRGMFGSRLNIVTDGSVMFGACGSRMDNPTSYISPESYDRLVVIKGPQTVRWGPTGSAGTVLFERDPQHFDAFTAKADGSLLYGTNGRFDARIDTTMGDTAGYVRFVGNTSRASDYRDGHRDRVPSSWDKWNGDLFLGWTPRADTVIEVSAGMGDGEARYAGRAMDGTQFRRESLGAKFIRSDIGGLIDKIEARVYYNYADHVMDNFRLRNPGPSMRMEREPDRQTMGGRLALSGGWGDVSFVTGFDVQTDTHRTRRQEDGRPTSDWDRNTTFYNYGLFGELTWSVQPGHTVMSGLRFDLPSIRDYRQASLTKGTRRDDVLPSGFLRYEREFDALPVTAYIGLGHAERFPDFWELVSPKATTNGGGGSAFTAIKPEKTTQIDIGAQYTGDRTVVWASAYVGYVEDFILFDYWTPQSRAGNVDAAILGGEGGVSWFVTPELKADASIAYAFGNNLSNHQALPQMPPLEARFGLAYEFGDWSVGGLWRLVASQNRIARDKGTVVGKDYDASAGFAVFSLNAGYRITESVRLTAGVDNLFGKSYTEHLNRDGDAGFGFAAHDPLREPGRTFWLKADFKL